MKPSSGQPLRLLSGFMMLGYLGWVVFPMAWMMYSSFKDDAAIVRDPFGWPDAGQLRWRNYEHAWHAGHLGEYFFNSIWVTTSSVLLIVLLGAMAAYALTRFYHPLSKVVFGLFLAGLMIPIQLSIVPLFFQLRALGMLNSLPGLVLVYVANGLPFAIFILAGFFRSLPGTLREAAVMDGCSESSVFWRIMLPLARPGLATVAIFQFIGIWKEYFFAFMLTSGGQERTLPLGLANLAVTSQYRSDMGMLFAGLVVVTFPILLIYLFLQRHLVRGMTAGAVKG